MLQVGAIGIEEVEEEEEDEAFYGIRRLLPFSQPLHNC
jgi:hypothetical protein